MAWKLAAAATVMTLLACGGGGSDVTSTSEGSETGGGTGNGTQTDSGSGGQSEGGTVGDSSDDSASETSESSDGGTDTGGVDPTPILEREPAISHHCTEARAMTQFPGATSSRVEGLVAQDDEFSIAITGDTIELGTVALDGTRGPTLALAAEPYTSRSPLVLGVDGDIVAVWTEYGGDEALRFARVDADLQFVVDPMDVPETAGTSVSATALVPTAAGGFALFYSRLSGDEANLYQLLLDANGQAVDDPVQVAALGPSYGAASASVVPTADGGHAVAYVADAGQGTEVFFVLLAADGTPTFAPKRISHGAGDGWSSGFGNAPRRNLLAVGDTFWLTYTEGSSDIASMEGYATVALAVVDGEGQAQRHALQVPTEGIEHRWPSLVQVDDRVAMTWTTGTIIWICGGCITDYDLNLVLLDPETIVPASEVVTQLHMTNGITAPLVAVDGADILTAGSLDFHALTMPASGALQCTPSG